MKHAFEFALRMLYSSLQTVSPLCSMLDRFASCSVRRFLPDTPHQIQISLQDSVHTHKIIKRKIKVKRFAISYMSSFKNGSSYLKNVLQYSTTRGWPYQGRPGADECHTPFKQTL